MECQKRGRRSDVYSLGCVFLEITTVLAGESLTALEEFLDKDNYDDEDDAGGECEVEYHQSLEKVTSWIERISVIDKDNKIHLPVQWCSQMLQRGADRRPYMNDLIQTVAKDTRPERDTQLLYFCPTCLEELQLRREITNEMTLNCMMEPSDAASDLDIEGTCICNSIFTFYLTKPF